MVVDVSMVPSARTRANVLFTVEASPMAVPLATCQHGSASTLPSADREGNPLASCQM